MTTLPAKGTFPYHVVADSRYWATRARLKREAWARMPETFDRRRRLSPTPQAVSDALALYRSGAPIARIVRESGVCHSTLYRAINEAGIGGRTVKRGPADTVRAEAFTRRYLAGETLEAIANDYGITRERVRQILRKAGVESLGIRPGHRRKPTPLSAAEQEALRLYQEGVRPKEIEARIGIAAKLMPLILRRGGVEAKSAGYWNIRPDDAELTAEIARLYTSGMSAAEIARTLPQIKYPETVYRYLKKAGVQPRYPRGSKRPIPSGEPPSCSVGAGGDVQAPGAASS